MSNKNPTCFVNVLGISQADVDVECGTQAWTRRAHEQETGQAAPRDDGPSKRFSAIIVHRNGADMLMNTLRALSHAVDAQRDEIIVVDNGSCDDSLAALRTWFPQITLAANGCNNGFARACNQGMRLARGRFLLLLNNDAVVPADLFTVLEAHFHAHPRLGLLGVQLVDETGRPHCSHGSLPCFTDAFDFKWRRRHQVRTNQRLDYLIVDAVVGACMATSREALDAVGLLDEEFFFYFEETEWSHRMRRLGWEVAVAQDTKVVHASGVSTRGLRKEAELEMFHSRLVFNRKIFSRPQACLLNSYWLLRLTVNVLANMLVTLATLGFSARARAKFGVYSYLFAWQLCGRPRRWGLPDKCKKI